MEKRIYQVTQAGFEQMREEGRVSEVLVTCVPQPKGSRRKYHYRIRVVAVDGRLYDFVYSHQPCQVREWKTDAVIRSLEAQEIKFSCI